MKNIKYLLLGIATIILFPIWGTLLLILLLRDWLIDLGRDIYEDFIVTEDSTK